MNSLMLVSREVENPINAKSLEIICNFTRFPVNGRFLARYEGLVDTLVFSANCEVPISRVSALRAFQNMSADGMTKTFLASDTVLSLMTSSALRKDPDEKEAAVATLYNISTEPGAVVAITNTRNVVATLVHLAHDPDSQGIIRLLACEALATISLWLQTLAGTGKVPEGVENYPLPSHKTFGWERWE